MNHRKNIIADIFLIILVIILNPVLFTFILDAEFTSPDSYSYISEAKNIYENLEFHTGPLGHVDISFILPPLYPSLIAFFMAAGIQALDAALLISQIAAILFSVVAYIYIKRCTTRLVAVVSVICIQLTYIYFNFATLALTESLFLFLLLLFFLFADYWHSKSSEQGYPCFIIGLLCSLVFLTRELGIAALLLLLIILFIQHKINETPRAENPIRQLIMILLGFSVLMLPYYSIRTLQTGQGPFTQKYRIENYVVTTSNPGIIGKIESLKHQKQDNYSDIYQNRRLLMELLPDSTEMLDYVVYDKPVATGEMTYEESSDISSRPAYLERLLQNIFFLADRSGFPVFMLFLIFFFTAFFFPSGRRKFPRRIVLPAFTMVYILLLSVFTGMIPRYVEIIVPVLLINICMELYYLVNMLKERYSIKGKLVAVLLITMIPTIVLAGSPKLYFEKHLYRHSPEFENNFERLGEHVNGETVFSLTPKYVYMIDGRYRQIPNDGLEKIAKYAQYTDVSWLLVNVIPWETETMQYWHKSYEWLILDNLEKHYPEIIKYCCGFYDTENGAYWMLYSFKKPE